jgi:hypothetical protein
MANRACAVRAVDRQYSNVDESAMHSLEPMLVPQPACVRRGGRHPYGVRVAFARPREIDPGLPLFWLLILVPAHHAYHYHWVMRVRAWVWRMRVQRCCHPYREQHLPP